MGPRHLKCATLLVAFSAAAQTEWQFSQLAVTDDGSQVYFVATPPYSGHVPYGTLIYRIAGREVRRVGGPTAASCGSQRVQYIANPQVNGDGTAFSLSVYCLCPGGLDCNGGNLVSSSVEINGALVAGFNGAAQFSRNGRFVSSTLQISEAVSNEHLVQVYYLDLQTGTLSQPPTPPADGRQALTNAGVLLCSDSKTGKLILWTPQTVTAVSTVEKPDGGVVNAEGTWVVFNLGHSPEIELRALEIASGREVFLDHSNAARFQKSISNDGSVVLYLSGQPAQAFLIHPDGTARRQLTDFAEGVTEAVLSGSGQTVIAISGPRIVSIDVATGAVRLLVSAPPAAEETPFSYLPRPCRTEPR